ncbi:MAG: universal stress protein [bacterium]|nr:universal stress protein [bacterium]
MDIKRILTPIDFSSRSRDEIRWAITLSRNFGSELLVLHVVPAEAADAALKGTGKSWDIVRAELIAEASLLVDEVCRELSVAGLEHEEHIVTGDPVEEILKTTLREKADLIVLSSRSRTGLSHALLGSVTEEIVRRAPVPVFTLNRETTAEAA